ncbi:1-acylglycerol-3-phosphate O [Panus rudis PR-1116 ss-1]|nr:1-acylglycerol-3-phosphate O [Panus rudis PR-1116 ss-1]
MSVLAYVVKPLAYVSLPMFLLSKFAESSPVGRYYIRLGLYLSTLGICSIWGALTSIGTSLVGQRFNANFITARTFYFLAGSILDIRIELEGEEYLNERPAVIVANHQSMLDILMLGRVFPKRASIMAKKELQWAPLLGQFLALSGAVFVDRGNSAQAIRSLTAAGEAMKSRNVSIWLFPEGTRSMRPYHDMLPFKKGAFHLAVNAQVPIVPVVVENYYKLYRKGVFESGVIKVKVLPPIPTTGLTPQDVTPLSTRVHDLMVSTLREISGPVLPSAYPVPEKPSSITADVKLQQAQDPLHTVPTIIESDPLSTSSSPTSQPPEGLVESRSESRASTYASDFSTSSPVSGSRRFGSENGAETEEDEGMVLVGRPPQ